MRGGSSSDDKLLKWTLLFFGLFLVGPFPFLVYLWPSGWRWPPYHPEYEHMIIGIYVTLGVFLLLASRMPQRHRSLLWFTVLSSVVHGGIMELHALMHEDLRGHLLGDATFTTVGGILLGTMMLRSPSFRAES